MVKAKSKVGRKHRKNNRCYIGHKMTPENTGVHSSTGYTYCRQCSRDHWRRYYFAKNYGLKQPPPRGSTKRGRKSVKDGSDESSTSSR